MLKMPALDESVLARRDRIVEDLRRIVPGEGVIDSEAGRRAYECDEIGRAHV